MDCHTWSTHLQQARLAGDHQQLASLYEQKLSEQGSDHVEDYWYLGLAYLLQDREADATATWLSTMAEADQQEVDRLQDSLVQTLDRAAQDEIRYGRAADSLLIRQAIHQINPRLVVNQYLMTLTNLALGLSYFTPSLLEDPCLQAVLLCDATASLKRSHTDVMFIAHRFLWIYGASQGCKFLRQQVAANYLAGQGIEIGALHNPMDVPADVVVRYVDRLSVAELRQHYPELAHFELVTIDILDDGETLNTVPDDSLDFVIASHMIEHCQDPISTLKTFLRVLHQGGIIFLVVPDKRYTFDRDRLTTSLEHLVRDHTEGPAWSALTHYEEWCRIVNHMPEAEITLQAQQLMEREESIHFHVWTQLEFSEFLNYCQTMLALPFEVELVQKGIEEFMVVLSKR